MTSLFTRPHAVCDMLDPENQTDTRWSSYVTSFDLMWWKCLDDTRLSPMHSVRNAGLKDQITAGEKLKSHIMPTCVYAQLIWHTLQLMYVWSKGPKYSSIIRIKEVR